jgi:penicillin-binding protein 2
MLSLDIGLQKLVEDMFGSRRGALVALDPKTGEVLAFVSKPTFDPNLFVGGIDQESWQALNESIDKPLLNRALRGTYPPGSTYKPFMAMAALQTGKRSPTAIINDPGFFMFGGHRFGSPENERGGAMDMNRAIVESSNVYFYTLANELGVEAIHDFMAPLGFGQATGIDINGEVRGVLPNQEWKRNYFKRAAQQKWFAGETISLGIGQGYNSFTMLQLAQATATLSNNGIKHKPRLVMGTQDAMTRALHPLQADPPVDLHYKPENVAIIRKALVGVTQGGTSTRVFAGAQYLSGGKTGTAQAVSMGRNDRYNKASMEEHQRDHAVYMAFAPADNPRIALAVIVENAGWGGGVAAPIARRVFDYVLLGQYPSEEDMLAVQTGKAVAPTGKPRLAADMVALLVGDTPGAMVSAAGARPVNVQKAEPAAALVKAVEVEKPANAAKAAKPVKATPVRKPVPPASAIIPAGSSAP